MKPASPQLHSSVARAVRRVRPGPGAPARVPGTGSRMGIPIQRTLGGLSVFLILGLMLWICPRTVAQSPLSNLVFTVGTTIQDAANQHWSYVLIGAPDEQVLEGRRFAVFGKPGAPGVPGAFSQRGKLARTADPATITALLNQAAVLGQNPTLLSNALNVLFRGIPGFTNQNLPQKVSTAVQIAASDPSTDELLVFLGNAHPGLNLCLGRAFSEPVGGVTTYEVREIVPAGGAAGDVVGRVTVTPGAPVVLPAPGRPFQVRTNDPLDHLRVRLRWGTPPDLRRLSLLGSGYNVWRIARGAAEAGEFHVTPPTLAQLAGNPAFAPANAAPVFPAIELDPGGGTGGAENPADHLNVFLSDDGRASGTTFNDGEEFYYFITARDILGRDGLVSPGGLARACRRLAPGPPTDVKVENAVLPGSTNQARLLVGWRQNTNDADAVTEYWIYRWTNPSGILTNDAAPLSHRVGAVPHAPGSETGAFLDDTPGALTAPNLSNVWYSVRAVSQAACDPLLSPHAGPAWGVLRQREAPAAVSGEVLGSCGTPVVLFQGFATNAIPAEPQTVHVRLTCVRRDPGIAWVRFSITNVMAFEEKVIGPVYFPPDGDTVQVEYEAPSAVVSQRRRIDVGCVAGTIDDRVSRAAVCVIDTPFPAAEQRETVFFAGQLLATALSSNDPLLAVLNGGLEFCLPANNVAPDNSGMVAMTFDYNDAPPVLVQALSNNVWLDVAVVTPDAGRVYWVSYPACLVGPVPPFRGCRLNLPLGDNDCAEHVTAGGAGGAIAPIRVRFRLTPRTREYRVYRRAGDGPLTLIAQGAANYDPAKPGKIIETRDEAMPPSAAQLCYFVQVLDEHGNGSPLSFLGCRNAKPAKLPRPVLAEPQPAGDASDPQVVLNWFCPTAGISRFQFKIRRTDAPQPSSASGLLSAQLTLAPAYAKALGFQGLSRNRLQIISFSEAQFTPPLSTGFGPGPGFTISARVVPNATYEVSVTPVDEQGVVHHGSSSEVGQFTWTPPVVIANVPWPARPLPPVRAFEPDDPEGYGPRVIAKVFETYEGNVADPRFPVGVRIGRFDNSLFFRPPNIFFGSNVGTNAFIRYSGFNTIVNPDPHLALFRSVATEPGLSGRSILPLVVYRQQVTNAWFPRVSGSVTQVSPLIERIPWTIASDTRDVVIPDRLFALHGETYNDHSYYFLYLRDQQPAVRGARYRYFVMRFNRQREIEEIIPAGEVEIPLSP